MNLSTILIVCLIKTYVSPIDVLTCAHSSSPSVNARVNQFSPSPIVVYHPFLAVRVFGVFTHAQLDHGGFWDTLSHQLQQGGPLYVERCNFRNKPASPGDNVISPATFPPLPIQDAPPIDPLIKVSEEDIKAVSNIDGNKEFLNILLNKLFHRFTRCICTSLRYPFPIKPFKLFPTSLEKFVTFSQVLLLTLCCRSS